MRRDRDARRHLTDQRWCTATVRVVPDPETPDDRGDTTDPETTNDRGDTTDPETTARLLRSRLATSPLELPVTGESMGSTIRSGSTVHLTDLSEPRRGEVWAFVGARSGIVVHRVRHLTDESMTGRGDANPLDDHTVPRTHLIGRVDSAAGPTGAVRRFGPFDRRRTAIQLYLRGIARKVLRPARRRRRPTESR